MCGIVGILLASHAADPRRLAAVESMATTLHHRGPDGGGIWIDRGAGIALGHRRLAIVDLSDAGRQPMLSHGEGLVMTFNGEIYNFADLRRELEAAGYRFRGHSDSEVMLAAFECLGIEPALRRFAGMFALGIWDRNRRVLHLVRDRLGKKPLYVALESRRAALCVRAEGDPGLPGLPASRRCRGARNGAASRLGPRSALHLARCLQIAAGRDALGQRGRLADQWI